MEVENQRDRHTVETRLKSWLRRPKTSPHNRIRGVPIQENKTARVCRLKNTGREEWYWSLPAVDDEGDSDSTLQPVSGFGL